MREAALFYVDFMAESCASPDGKRHSYPATSPENCALGRFEGAGRLHISIDPTMDIAAVKSLLKRLLYITERFGIADPDKAEFSDLLGRLPEYRVNADGALAEWIHADFEDNYRHRHLSHLYPFFPGTEITRKSELFGACVTALDKRKALGLKDLSGWAITHLACAYARARQGNDAFGCLKLAARHLTGPNLFSFRGDGRDMGVSFNIRWCRHVPHQMDANCGFTAAIADMIAFADGEGIHIIPAIPDCARDFRAYGLTLRYGAELLELTLEQNILRFRLRLGERVCPVCLPEEPETAEVNGRKVAPSREIIGADWAEGSELNFTVKLIDRPL